MKKYLTLLAAILLIILAITELMFGFIFYMNLSDEINNSSWNYIILAGIAIGFFMIVSIAIDQLNKFFNEEDNNAVQ